MTSDEDNDLVGELLDLIRLERLEVNLFRGPSRDIGTPRVFGGQVLAQAVQAAAATVEERDLHSLHAYFLRAGDPDAPIVYSVDRSRDGRSFTARRVVAIQHGRQIFTLAASFQLRQPGVEHQAGMPEVPDPESLSDNPDLAAGQMAHVPPKIQRWFSRFGPFEFRPVTPLNPWNPEPGPPRMQTWFRLRGHVGEDDGLHRTLLAYASDFHLIGTAVIPHGLSFVKGNLLMASLDHAMWFHRDCRVDEWLLYDCDSPSAGGSRGLARGLVFNRSGSLVASVAQEGMIRAVKPENEQGGNSQ